MPDPELREASGAVEPAEQIAPAEAEQVAEANKDESLASAENAAEPADGDTPDDGGEPADDEPRKKRTRSERARDRLIRDNAALRERLRALEERVSSSEPRPAAEEDPEPKEADFNGDWFKFQTAHTRWAVRQETQELRKEIRESGQRDSLEQQKRSVITEFEKKAAEFKKAVPDFDEVMSADFDVRPSPAVAAMTLRSDVGPALAYHLATNPDTVERLNGLSDLDAAREIGRIEAKLSPPAARKSTQAPAPLTPLKGSAAITKAPDKMSIQEYAAWRAAGGGT